MNCILSSLATESHAKSRPADVVSKVYLESSRSSLEYGNAFVQKVGTVNRAVYDSVFGNEVVEKARAEQERPGAKYYVPDFSTSSDKYLSKRINERLESIYAADAAAMFDSALSRVAIRMAVDAVEEAIEKGDYVSLDELLLHANPECLRKITAVSLLRTAFRVKNKVSKWNRFYTEVFAYLSRTEQDPHHALRGLVRA